MRLTHTFLSLALLSGVAQFSAWADTPVSSGIWYEFYWADTVNPFGPSSNVPTSGCTDPTAFCPISPPFDVVWVGDPAWTYTAPPSGALFTITDVADAGDSFNVYDFGNLILSTPTVPANGYICGTTNIDYVDPAVCVGDPNMSHGQVDLAPGAHSLTVITRDAPFGDGVADFNIHVPEPASALSLLCQAVVIIGLVGFRRWGNRRRQTNHG